MIDDRRLIGIDLGIASDHTVRVLDGGGGEVCRRRAPFCRAAWRPCASSDGDRPEHGRRGVAP